jgi:hypothetical protein
MAENAGFSGVSAATPLDVLEADICRLAAQISVATAQLLVLVAEFDARAGWVGVGVKSCAHWLSWRCHVGVHAAREQVGVARALAELPLTRTEFVAGRLSYAKVRALTRVAEPDSEADLVELALNATAAQTERAVRGWRRAEVAASDAAAEVERRYLSHYFDDDGMLVVRARLGAEEGALFLAGLEKAQQRSAKDASAVEDSLPAPLASAVDGLAAMSKAVLNGDGDAAREPDTQLVVRLDAAVLQRAANAGLAAHADGGGALTSAQARRLACDSRLLVMLAEDRDVLDVGRSTRVVPAALRRAVHERDKGCRMPGCAEHRRRKLHAHHVWHWADGGPTCLNNLVSLCKAHHHAIHDRGYRVIAAADGGFEFFAPGGRALPGVVPLTTTDPCGPVSLPVPIIDPERIPTWKGETFTLDYIISTLRQSREHRRRAQTTFQHEYAWRPERASPRGRPRSEPVFAFEHRV